MRHHIAIAGAREAAERLHGDRYVSSRLEAGQRE